MRTMLGLGLLASLLLFPLRARAESPEVASARTRDGYKYVFEDDPLPASAFDPNDTRIRVVPGATRRTLIRPRTNFVAELLVSVEKI